MNEEIINAIVNKLSELKAEDIKVAKLSNNIFSTAILATGNSSRHVLSLTDNICDFLKQKYKIYTKSEGNNSCEWVIIDANNLIINIFQKHSREKYNLEEIWKLSSN
ncbi:ribosome silencing factor [Rickettsiales endosymbiont of Trichoplax sp. H2]|uniref:ribosome silencing factor n=1 Tax=Rickettsiales endosymbiont of Trichoplax sp. H2 TaxID=2021221 RepID=UPI0012B406E1|nr:ribosome silencing factor [Rickettsiales endosymbiont of Trichoplax sp. H2]MSO14485.1 Ribosomal silencing factor RsfS [Rickettsiales endosymbiont of Trichoplax sp. H2]